MKTKRYTFRIRRDGECIVHVKRSDKSLPVLFVVNRHIEVLFVTVVNRRATINNPPFFPNPFLLTPTLYCRNSQSATRFSLRRKTCMTALLLLCTVKQKRLYFGLTEKLYDSITKTLSEKSSAYPFKLQLSMGSAEYVSEATPQELFVSADKKLYEEKNAR